LRLGPTCRSVKPNPLNPSPFSKCSFGAEGEVMSTEMQTVGHRDPRTYVARCGFFTQRPDVVEEYLWELGLPTAAERVFWFHWREGMRAGDWCSSVPIKVVAARCRLDVSTV